MPFALSEYRLKKDYGAHNNSVGARMYEHPRTKERIVEKIFAGRQASTMRQEIKILRRLANCPFVPHLVHVDEPKQRIYMTYCGKPVKTLSSEQKAEVKKMLYTLKHTYKISRSFHYLAHWGFPKNENITWQNGKLHLIDFGYPWTVKKSP